MAWGTDESGPPHIGLLSCTGIFSSSRTTGKEAEDKKIGDSVKIGGRVFRKDTKKERKCENRKRAKRMKGEQIG